MNQRRSTSSAALFGLILAMCHVVLRVSLGPTLGVGAFLLLIGLQLMATAWLPWSRLGLRWTSLRPGAFRRTTTAPHQVTAGATPPEPGGMIG